METLCGVTASARMQNTIFFCLFLICPVVSQKLEFVDVATGSLGQGLGAACGMAYTGKHFDKSRLVCIESRMNTIGWSEAFNAYFSTGHVMKPNCTLLL